MFGLDPEDAAAGAPLEGKSAEEMQAAVFRNSLRVIPGK